MFTTVYTLFNDALNFLDPLWDVLNTRVSLLPLVDLGGSWFEGLGTLVINNLITIVKNLALNLIGDVTLMEFLLGGGLVVIITIYIIKFVLSAIPLA